MYSRFALVFWKHTPSGAFVSLYHSDTEYIVVVAFIVNKNFSGILVSDGYGGYLKVEVIRARCWAHMRRKWVEAMPRGVSSENSTAVIGLKYCTELFEFEHSIEHLSDEQRAAKR